MAVIKLNKEYRKALKNFFRAEKGVIGIHILKRGFELLADSKNTARAAYGRCGLIICYYKLKEIKEGAK